MKYTLLLIFTMLCSLSSWASQHQMIDTLGSSSKGQFVALEEYGYRHEKKTYYVTIKIVNVWTKEYVGKTTQVELPAIQTHQLAKAREQAKLLAGTELRKYKIQLAM